ncbi:hypothetical protein M472_02885 [Sphingobacterium paucimobilis HER1398]|uniref:Uncharacterized protein n=2 Tax=Sphingobacterium TaxID=28453 RepID=U2IYD0_9SPHI|nr:hypothetical protein M472_02885 [Sphingobacterium paucimobilis HER1398]
MNQIGRPIVQMISVMHQVYLVIDGMDLPMDQKLQVYHQVARMMNQVMRMTNHEVQLNDR